MNILINGVSFRNKGAELMLRAIVDHFRDASRVTGLAVACRATSKQLEGYAPCNQFTTDSSGALDFDSIDAVIDASGFAFSDQWPPRSVRNICRKLTNFAKAGKKVILLPQAFGPFLRKEIRPSCQELFSLSNLIFPRDRISFKFVQELVPNRNNLLQAPDFTNLVEGRLPSGSGFKPFRACILPNARMLDKTNTQIADAYLHFLEHAITAIKNKGIDLFMLFNDNRDAKVVSQLSSDVLEGVSVERLTDPVEIKSAIGASLFVVGSRFHGLVNALSQGVPSLGTSWSHKYQTLFEEYGCPDFLITDLEDNRAISEKLNFLTSTTARKQIVGKIEKFSLVHKESAKDMWSIVDTCLFL